MSRIYLNIASIMAFLLLAGCQSEQKTPAEVEELRPGILKGYLTMDEQPNALKLLPPAPLPGSAREQVDIEENQRTLKLQGSPRWEQAKVDANLRFPDALDSFACAVDLNISEQNSPFVYQILRRTLADAGFSTSSAKKHYNRERPFMVNGVPTCLPEQDGHLRENGSYPSGHTAIGWAWGLILSELLPERKDLILKRGWEFGESRKVCNVHWNSDVLMGRTMGSAVFAALHSNEQFRQDLAQARKEIEQLKNSSQNGPENCHNPD